MIVGIDLGTTNSSISAYVDGELKLIPNAFGKVLTPSVVSFDEDGSYFVGAIAKERLVTNPDTTFKEFKRDMGSGKIYEVFGKQYKPEDLSALILKQLKADAERVTGQRISDAVISVPAYFTDKQRAATRNAGLIAGLNVICLINEPSAAALTYHVDNMDKDEKYLVFDFGGGTLDVTLVDAFDNIIEIENISGDNYLGGADFNKAIAIDICKKHRIPWSALSSDKKEILLNVGEEIKIHLTDHEQCDYVVNLDSQPYEYTLTRQGLVEISSDIFNKITIVLKRIMNDAGIAVNEVDGVIMIGGSSKMPIIQAFINKLFDGFAKYEINGDTIVCLGAGIVAGIKERNDLVKDIILTDIAPFSLGTGVADGSFSVIIPKNQVLPCSSWGYFQTTRDYQEKVEFTVYQGENIIASKNQVVRKITIPIERRLKGEVKIAVNYSYDINGIFDVDITGDGIKEEVHEKIGLSEGDSSAEIQSRRKKLDEMKTNPQSQEEDLLVVEKAGRLAAECNAEQRVMLEKALMSFLQTCRQASSKLEIKEAKRRLESVMVIIEKSMFSFADFDADMWREMIEGTENSNPNKEE
ncbi:MAG: Hsp70 family protein [Pseudobutyrivibrio sp.]|nr:Hsp70 family protein [Pseudobutyrivibrio sp.]